MVSSLGGSGDGEGKENKEYDEIQSEGTDSQRGDMLPHPKTPHKPLSSHSPSHRRDATATGSTSHDTSQTPRHPHPTPAHRNGNIETELATYRLRIEREEDEGGGENGYVTGYEGDGEEDSESSGDEGGNEERKLR
jgi:hypothetical protein